MNSKRLSLTLILIIINVVVFIALSLLFPPQVINHNGQEFLKLHPFAEKNLAVSPPNVFQGRIWTLFTNMFMHAPGPVGSQLLSIHLIINMISLYFVGNFLERLIGKKKFILIYLLSGLVASLFFVFLAPGSTIPAVGASGAIFGIAGVLMLITPRVPTYLMFIPIAIPLYISVIIALVVMWLASVSVGLPIGNTAHLGGLIAGLIYGYYLRKKHAKKVQYLDSIFRKMY